MMQQGTFEDTNAEYAEFCKKFAPKKTTDDCYTPPNVYNAVFDWVARRYGLTTDTPVVRPFVPGGDFERFDYPKDALVLDNPPFSILSKIVKFYNANGVRFFLFAPALTLFSGSADTQTNYVIAGASITYENGAVVNTSFVTNMGEYLIETAPDLRAAVKAANEANRASTTKELPTYSYPDCVAHAAGLNYLAVHGQAFKVRRRDALFVRSLDAMRDAGKAIFGGGYLLTEAVAAERAEAEAAAAEQAAAERAEADRIALARAKETQWQLSDREREMQKLLARPART